MWQDCQDSFRFNAARKKALLTKIDAEKFQQLNEFFVVSRFFPPLLLKMTSPRRFMLELRAMTLHGERGTRITLLAFLHKMSSGDFLKIAVSAR